VDVTIAFGATQVKLVVAPDGADGFAVGMPVWLRNECDYRARMCCIRCCDIEEAAAEVDLNITGVYGRVIAVEPDDNVVVIELEAPLAGAAQFKVEWKAALLVSPKDAMGFYWEPSPGLVDLAKPGT